MRCQGIQGSYCRYPQHSDSNTGADLVIHPDPDTKANAYTDCVSRYLPGSVR